MCTDNFKWLIGWFQSYDKGAREGFPRIHVGTIANPGWSFCINLKGTGLDEKKFIKVEIDRSDSDWIFCFIKNEFFEGRCGLNNLSEALAIFRNRVVFTCFLPFLSAIQMLKNNKKFLFFYYI